MTKKANEPEIYVYKFNARSFEFDAQGLTIPKLEVFEVDPSVEIHYFAFNRTKPVDPSLRQLVGKLSLGGPDILAQVQEWVDSGHYINTTNADEQSLLHVACQYSQEAVAKWLVEKGIDLGQRDKNGWTPLLCAINAPNLSLVDYLIKKGALRHPIFTTNGSSIMHYLVRIVPSEAEVPLYLRILEDVSKLYQAKTMQPNFAIQTPLHQAASSGNQIALTWLLDPIRPFNFDPNDETAFGDTVLHHGVTSGNPKIVSYLIAHPRIDVPARAIPHSPYNRALKLRSPEISNLFPVEAKLRISSFHTFILQLVLEPLDIVSLVRCTEVNQKFRFTAKSTIHRKYKGKAPEKVTLWAAIDIADSLLQEDIKATESPNFLDGYDKYTNPGVAPPENYTIVKCAMIGGRYVGCTTLLQVGLDFPNQVDFVIKTLDYKGQTLKIQFWDKYFRNPRWLEPHSSLFRGISVLLIVYNASDPDWKLNFELWMTSYERYAMNCVILFVGTHSEKAVVSRAEVQEYIKEKFDIPANYTEQCTGANAAEIRRFPYVVETSTSDPASIHRAFRLAIYMAVRFKTNYIATNPVIVRQPPKKSFVSTFKNLFK